MHAEVTTMMTVQNPVLTGFNPDPSILCVGEDFYMANSTFEWFPGVSIYHSRDLAHWELASRPLDTSEFLDMRGTEPSSGIWAPDLSFDNGTFYLIFTNVKTWSKRPYKDCLNYITTAKDIRGPWSKPVYLNSSGFDPSLFHADDGRKYLVNMEWDYRPEGQKKFTGILVQEMDPVTFELLGNSRNVFPGTPLGLTEGPHIYQKDGYYYLMTAEGGTFYTHAVTVCRSRDLFGPYEVHPQNPMVTTLNNPGHGLQKAGHGSLCQGPDGRWWIAFLCGRPINETRRCNLGRETGINPVIWKEGWPYLENGTSLPSLSFDSPYGDALPEKQDTMYYTFHDKAFLRDFQTLRLPYDARRFSIEANPGFLRIYGRESMFSPHEQSILARRQTDFSFEAETCFTFRPTSFQHMAGMSYRYNETNQYLFRVSWDAALNSRVIGLLKVDNGNFSIPYEEPIPDGDVTIRLVVKRETGRFFYSVAGGDWVDTGLDIDATILSDDYANPVGFTGAFVGMLCTDMLYQKAYADFKYFKYSMM